MEYFGIHCLFLRTFSSKQKAGHKVGQYEVDILNLTILQIYCCLSFSFGVILNGAFNNAQNANQVGSNTVLMTTNVQFP